MDFDELRGLADDDRDDDLEQSFTIDDFVDDGDEFEIGREIGDEDEEFGDMHQEPFLGMNPMERMVLSIMFFFNILILGYGMLIVTGRVG